MQFLGFSLLSTRSFVPALFGVFTIFSSILFSHSTFGTEWKLPNGVHVGNWAYCGRLMRPDGSPLSPLEHWLADPSTTSDLVMDFLSQKPEFKRAFASPNTTGETIREHVRIVDQAFSRNRYGFATSVFGSISNSFRDFELLAFLKLVIVLHDVGKPEAKRRNKPQSEINAQWMSATLKELGYPEKLVKLGEVLVSENIFGDFFKDRESTTSIAHKVKSLAKSMELPERPLFGLMYLLYISDVSGYPEILDETFEVRDGTLVPRDPRFTELTKRMGWDLPYSFEPNVIEVKDRRSNRVFGDTVKTAKLTSQWLLSLPGPRQINFVSGGTERVDDRYFRGLPKGAKKYIPGKGGVTFRHYTEKTSEIIESGGIRPGIRSYIDPEAHERRFYEDVTGVFITGRDTPPENLKLGLNRRSDFIEFTLDDDVPLIELESGLYVVPLPESVQDWILELYRKFEADPSIRNRDMNSFLEKFQRLSHLGAVGNELLLPIRPVGVQKNGKYSLVKPK